MLDPGRYLIKCKANMGDEEIVLGRRFTASAPVPSIMPAPVVGLSGNSGNKAGRPEIWYLQPHVNREGGVETQFFAEGSSVAAWGDGEVILAGQQPQGWRLLPHMGRPDVYSIAFTDTMNVWTLVPEAEHPEDGGKVELKPLEDVDEPMHTQLFEFVRY
ncbi:hypothetical protein TWF696_008044 [Orbilia brochopaga]|uniref:Uncharacterized protein n=1 Tax=Orbilia brochopaga TaxID=3140254 RepID=A0AAV9ULX3_9PEZI